VLAAVKAVLCEDEANMEEDIVIKIEEHVRQLLAELSEPERHWLHTHLVPPRTIELANGISTSSTIRVWLVTDHVGNADASYRIVYNPEEDEFGYECTLENERELFVGHVGTLRDAVEGL
jgi:hypothetical protein